MYNCVFLLERGRKRGVGNQKRRSQSSSLCLKEKVTKSTFSLLFVLKGWLQVRRREKERETERDFTEKRRCFTFLLLLFSFSFFSTRERKVKWRESFLLFGRREFGAKRRPEEDRRPPRGKQRRKAPAPLLIPFLPHRDSAGITKKERERGNGRKVTGLRENRFERETFSFAKMWTREESFERKERRNYFSSFLIKLRKELRRRSPSFKCIFFTSSFCKCS